MNLIGLTENSYRLVECAIAAYQQRTEVLKEAAKLEAEAHVFASCLEAYGSSGTEDAVKLFRKVCVK